MNISESLAMLFELEKAKLLVGIFVAITTFGIAGVIYIGKVGFDKVNERRKGRK